MAAATGEPDDERGRPAQSLADDAACVLDLFMDCRYADCGRLLAIAVEQHEGGRGPQIVGGVDP